jgi:hypothetical protein
VNPPDGDQPDDEPSPEYSETNEPPDHDDPNLGPEVESAAAPEAKKQPPAPDRDRQRRYSGGKLSPKVEARIAFVADTWASRPSTGYQELERLVMKTFGCGHGGAQQAIKVARSRRHEAMHDPQLKERLVADFWIDIEESRRAGKFNASINAKRALAQLLGLNAPLEMTLTTKDHRVMAELTDDQIAAMAAADRVTAELEERERRAAAGDDYDEGALEADGGDPMTEH